MIHVMLKVGQISYWLTHQQAEAPQHSPVPVPAFEGGAAEKRWRLSLWEDGDLAGGLAMLGWTQSESDVKSLWSYVIPNPIGLPVQHRDFAFLRKHDAINQFPTIPAIALTSCSLVMPCSLCKSKIGVARLLGHQQRIIPSFCSRYMWSSRFPKLLHSQGVRTILATKQDEFAPRRTHHKV